MFQFLYVLWVLLPLCFVGLWIWAFVKPFFGVHGKESARSYFSQAIFCGVCLAIAIFLDQKILLDIEDVMFIDELNVDGKVLRWLLYPAVLVFFAALQAAIYRKPPKSHSKFTGTAQALR